MLVKHTLCLSAYSITVWVGDHIGTVHLHQIGLKPEAGLAGAGTADDQHVFIARILWVLRAAGHSEPFGLGQNDIILEHRVDIGGNIVVGAP